MKRAARSALRALVEPLPRALKRQILELLQADARLHHESAADDAKVQALLAQALRASEAGDHGAAEGWLEQAMRIAPADPRLPPHLSRARFLKARSTDAAAQAATAEMQATLAAMEAEIRRHPLYVPGEFWATYGRFSTQLLVDYGLENFKRTVTHSYQNWMTIHWRDAQVRRLLELWPAHRSHLPWRNAMEAPDHVGSSVDAHAPRPEYPLAFAAQRDVYRVAVGLLWEYVLSGDTQGVLEGLTELEVGNPVRIWREGRLISSDLAHSVRERNLLFQALGLDGSEGLTVAELGAGHGRLAEVFGRTTNYRYLIFDITPALYVSQWYVKRIFPAERIFEFRHFDSFAEVESELRECRFAFFTPNQIELMPDDACELFINMNSLMEMRADQIRNFLVHIDRLTTRAFLSRQTLKWSNPDDKLSVSKQDFALGPRWRLRVDQVDDIHPGFFDQVWERS